MSAHLFERQQEETGFDYMLDDPEHGLVGELQEIGTYDDPLEVEVANPERGVVGGQQQDRPIRIRRPQPQVRSPVDLSPNDVICERGGRNWSHPGNIDFRQKPHNMLLELTYNGTVYRDLHPAIKTSLSWDLVHWVHQQDGRFVARDKLVGGGYSPWYVVTESTAREKASQYFRDENKRNFA